MRMHCIVLYSGILTAEKPQGGQISSDLLSTTVPHNDPTGPTDRPTDRPVQQTYQSNRQTYRQTGPTDRPKDRPVHQTDPQTDLKIDRSGRQTYTDIPMDRATDRHTNRQTVPERTGHCPQKPVEIESLFLLHWPNNKDLIILHNNTHQGNPN